MQLNSLHSNGRTLNVRTTEHDSRFHIGGEGVTMFSCSGLKGYPVCFWYIVHVNGRK